MDQPRVDNKGPLNMEKARLKTSRTIGKICAEAEGFSVSLGEGVFPSKWAGVSSRAFTVFSISFKGVSFPPDKL